MKLGLLFAIAACFLWGLIFIIPQFLSEFTPMEVTFGRYLSYGLLSVGLLMRQGWGGLSRFPRKAWVIAFTFALLANVLYYLGLIVALRFATPAVTVLILGMTPIVVAFYANWHVRELSFRQLLFPCLWMAAGILLINIASVDWTFQKATIGEYLIGLTCVIGALACWSWYAVSNARFLKMNSSIERAEWSTLIGIGSLVWVLILGALLLVFSPEALTLPKLIDTRFILGVLILGVVCSWLACTFWNRASSYLPMSLMGALIIFETLFGILFVFLYEMRIPSLFEIFGILLMLGGIGLILMRQRRGLLTQNTDIEG